MRRLSGLAFIFSYCGYSDYFKGLAPFKKRMAAWAIWTAPTEFTMILRFYLAGAISCLFTDLAVKVHNFVTSLDKTVP